MAWDADSNRVSFTSSTGGTTQFVYDITAGIPAVVEEIMPDESVVRYVREPDGSLIAMFVGSYPYYYHFDALGSTRLLTDETGHITDTYSYDAWGNLIYPYHTGDTQQPYQYVGQLGYYTHYQDSNMGLLQLGVRFYDPALGRFGQEDRIPGVQESAYTYCKNSCMRAVDPWGLQTSFPLPSRGLPDAASEASKLQCEMEDCASKMAAGAFKESDQSEWPGIHGGPRDALRHCIWSCKMKVHCPGGTSWAAGTWLEITNPGSGIRMDLGNNAFGGRCGKSILGGSKQSCLECCMSSGLNWPSNDKWQ